MKAITNLMKWCFHSFFFSLLMCCTWLWSHQDKFVSTHWLNDQCHPMAVAGLYRNDKMLLLAASNKIMCTWWGDRMHRDNVREIRGAGRERRRERENLTLTHKIECLFLIKLCDCILWKVIFVQIYCLWESVNMRLPSHRHDAYGISNVFDRSEWSSSKTEEKKTKMGDNCNCWLMLPGAETHWTIYEFGWNFGKNLETLLSVQITLFVR